MASGVNRPFNENYTFEIGDIVVYNGGTGYVTAPAVTFVGGGGSGAEATSTIDAGVVTGITVTKPGSGYTSTPTISIVASPGTTAVAYARLTNAKVRTFDTTMKFDRTLEASNTAVTVESIYNIPTESRTRVSEWAPSVSYLAGDVIKNSFTVTREPVRVDIINNIVQSPETVTIDIVEEYFVPKAYTSSTSILQDINQNKLIKIDPSLKFGRVKNTTDILEWQPNTS